MHTTLVSFSRCLRIAYLLMLVALITIGAPRAEARPGLAAAATTSSPMWVTDGSVATTVVSGNRVYIGGNFSTVGPPTGGFGAVDHYTGSTAVRTPNVTGIVYAMVEDGTGGWYIGGTFSHVGGLERNNLAHIRADGTVDPDWNPNATTDNTSPYRVVWALAVSHGVVFIGGEFTTLNGQQQRYLAAVDAGTGTLMPWNIQTNSQVWTIVADDSTVYVGGLFTSIAGEARGRLAALDTATQTLIDYNPNASGAVTALVLYNDTLYATGGFSTIGGYERDQIAALDLHTGAATAWNPNTNPSRILGRTFGLAVSESTVYIGGEFDSIGDKGRQNIAAIDRITGAITDWNPGADNWVMGLAVHGTTVYANGMFSRSGGQPRYRIAALDATTGVATDWDPHIGWIADHTLSPFADSNLPGVIHPSGTSIYLGGAFTTIGGEGRNNVAALDATTGVVTDWNPNVDGMVYDLLIKDSTVYIGGAFTHVDAQLRNHLAALDVTTGAVISWNPDADGSVRTLAAHEATIYAGGSFSTIGSQPRMHIAAIDMHTGSATFWHPDADEAVDTLVVTGTTVYAGGSFTTIGGQPRSHVAALATTHNMATAWDPNPTRDTSTHVTALAVRGNRVYVGGSFTAIGGQPRTNLAAIDATTGAATSWNPVGTTGFIGAIGAIEPDGSVVYVGGGFIVLGGQPLSHLVAIDAMSGAPLPWPASVSGTLLNGSGPGVVDLAVSDSRVYAAGLWKNVGTSIQPSFASFPAVAPRVRTYAATQVTETRATLNGSVCVYSGSASVAFEYTLISGDYTNPITIAAVPGTVTDAYDTPVRGTLSGLSPGITYFYRVVATGDAGMVVADEQRFTTPALELPTISKQPSSLSVVSGTSVTLTVAITGTAPFSYQWYEGESGDTSRVIAGATTSSFVTPQLTKTAHYWVRVTNMAGFRDSTTIPITVIASSPRTVVIYVPLIRR